MSKASDPSLRSIAWQRSSRAEFPYLAEVDGQHWVVRVNDFPAEAMYTLLIDGAERADYDDWPAAWRRPA